MARKIIPNPHQTIRARTLFQPTQISEAPLTALVNTSGQVQERYLYDPYGSVTATDASWTRRIENASTYGWRYLHQGGRLDTTTGWYASRNRDLIPSEGRCADRDPLGFRGGDLNLYRDEGSGPATSLDPEGLADRVKSSRLFAYYGDEEKKGDIPKPGTIGVGSSFPRESNWHQFRRGLYDCLFILGGCEGIHSEGRIPDSEGARALESEGSSASRIRNLEGSLPSFHGLSGAVEESIPKNGVRRTESEERIPNPEFRTPNSEWARALESEGSSAS